MAPAGLALTAAPAGNHHNDAPNQRIEAGKLMPDAFTVNAGTLVADVHALFAARARDRGLSLEVENDVRLATLAISGDERRIRQVLVHLVANALNFTHEGGICLRCSVLTADHEQARLRFEVTDTGTGMTPEQSARLFDPFEPVEVRSQRQAGTDGRGLAICRRLVKLMDGNIGVTSRPGQGSTFWFEVTLPGSPGAPQPRAIDRQIGLKYAAGRPELYDRVLVRFRELHSRDHITLARALAAEDRATTQRLLHSLKGVAAMIGALGLRDEATRLEGRCLAGAASDEMAQELDGLATLLADVAAEIDLLRAELQYERQQNP